MFNRIRVVTLLTTILVLFSFLQFSAGGLFFSTIRSDKQNFIFNQHIRELQTSLGTAWMALVQARTLLNQAGMSQLYPAAPALQQADSMNRIDSKLQLAHSAMADFNEKLTPDEAQSLYSRELNIHYQKYYAVLTALRSHLKERNIGAFMQLPTQQDQDSLEKAFENWLIDCDKLVKQGEINNQQAYVRAYWLLIILLIVIPVTVLFAWQRLQQSLIRPLKESIRHIHGIAQGELTSPITIDVRNEIGELLTALQFMQSELVRTVSVVRTEASEIYTSASAISSDYQNLSARTEQQAAALVQTAASMEQFTAAVKQNGDNASAASTVATNASQIAQGGNQVVNDLVNTMRSIAESSQRIADIISMIDGIAFQTNILALNAAVEAARAGEQGRGFAVVAGEVRNLAQSTAQAAKEIKGLIEDSVGRINIGASHADHAGETMQAIMKAVTDVTILMEQIATASHEQNQGITQVSIAVSDMDRVTQQNALLVEASAHTTSGLETRANRLNQAVALFRIS